MAKIIRILIKDFYLVSSVFKAKLVSKKKKIFLDYTIPKKLKKTVINVK